LTTVSFVKTLCTWQKWQCKKTEASYPKISYHAVRLQYKNALPVRNNTSGAI